MDKELPTKLAPGNAKVAQQPNYLEELALQLSRYRELLNILEERLNVVSERSPSEPEDSSTADRVHISTMVYVARRNNRDLDRIINEIAL